MNRSSEFRVPSSELILAALPAEGQLWFVGACGADPLSIAAGPSQSDGLITFTGTAYTGGIMRPSIAGKRPGTPVVVDLASLVKASAQIPSLRDHDPNRIVGHSDVNITSSAILVRDGVISGSGDDANEVVSNSRKGFRWQLSIGADKGERGELQPIAAGKRVLVNGQEFVGPLLVARNYSLNHISFEPVGADSKTSATLAASMFYEEGAIMKFSDWLKAKKLDYAKLTANQRKAWRAAFNADLLASGLTAVAEDDEEDADELEASGGDDLDETEGDEIKAGGETAPKKKRKSALDAITAGAATDGDALDRELDGQIRAFRRRISADTLRVQEVTALGQRYTGKEADAIIATALEEGWDAERTEFRLMKARDVRASRPNAQQQGQQGAPVQGRILAAAMCMSVGIGEDIACEGLSEQEGNLAASATYRSFKLSDLMRETIHAAHSMGYGERWSGGTASDGFIDAAMYADRFLTGRHPETGAIRAANFSTISVSGIVSNIAQKSLLSEFMGQEVVWNQIAGVRSHPNFKPTTSYRFEATGGFKKVAATGELQHIGVTESSFSNQIDTEGAMIVLTRRMMIDDDLGAFSRLPGMLGKMAVLAIEEGVFVMFLSGLAGITNFLKTTGKNKNHLTGAGSALGISALTTAKTTFGKLVDANNKPILIPGRILLTGVTLQQTAEDLVKLDKLIATTANATQAFEQNPHAGKYKHVYSPYVDNDAIKIDGEAISGQSAKKWWLLPEPGNVAPVVVGFLNGQQQPTIRQADTTFSTLGVQMSAHLDFGVGTEEAFLVQNDGE